MCFIEELIIDRDQRKFNNDASHSLCHVVMGKSRSHEFQNWRERPELCEETEDGARSESE